MILTSRLVNASEALSIGLVNRVVEEDDLMAEASATLAQQIAAGAPIAARYLKEAVSQGLDMPLDQGLRLETDLNVLLHRTARQDGGYNVVPGTQASRVHRRVNVVMLTDGVARAIASPTIIRKTIDSKKRDCRH